MSRANRELVGVGLGLRERLVHLLLHAVGPAAAAFTDAFFDTRDFGLEVLDVRAVLLAALFLRLRAGQQSRLVDFALGRRLGFFLETRQHFAAALELVNRFLERAEAPVAEVVAVFALFLDEDCEAVGVEAFVDDFFDEELLLLFHVHAGLYNSARGAGHPRRYLGRRAI